MFRCLRPIALALLLCCAPAFGAADPRTDHIEDELARLLPDYQRWQAPQPDTQPDTQPTTEPTTQPVPVLYAEIGGIPADAKPVASGELSKLTGKVRLTSTSGYTATGDITAQLYAETPGTVAIVPPGKRAVLRSVAAGFTLDGKGKGGLAADDDNTHAMVSVEDDALLHTVRVTGSQGVGCSIDGVGAKSYFAEFDHNGAQGRGGKCRGDGTEGSGYTEYDPQLHDNNAAGFSNAGNKITRCADWLIVRPHYRNERGPSQWLDNYNQRITLVDAVFEGGLPDRKNPPVAFRSELGLPGGVKLIRPVFINVNGTCLSLDESSNIHVTDPTFIGKNGYAAELRNMLRKDDDTGKWKNGAVVDETKFTCRLFDVSITGTVTLSAGTGPVVVSGAKSKGVRPVTLINNRLRFAAPLVVKIPTQ